MELSRDTEQILLKFFKSIELCETLFIDSHIGFVIGYRETGQILVVNNAFTEMTGYSRKELLTMRYRDLVPEESALWIKEVIAAKLENENASDVFEHRIVQKTGGQVWLQSRIYKLDDDLALVKEIDITEAKITEAALTRSLNLQKKPLPDSISGAERAIARLVAAGLSSKEIADQINLAPRTVDNHRSSIRKKLGVSNTFTLRDTLQSYTIANSF
jgi:PAS domain S-box-containing protein